MSPVQITTSYFDPFGATWQLGYDPHVLLPVRTTDPVGNVSQAQINYRVVQPWLITDANGNRSGVRFDALGMVVATAVMGKLGAREGDVLDESTEEASTRDDPTNWLDYHLKSVPVYLHTSARERHGAANPRWQESYSYSDGAGRVALTKVQAEPGLAPVRGPDGVLVRNPDGSPVQALTQSRWVATGRTIDDNKGNPVKQYEPYFAPDPRFDTEAALVQYGVTPILRYDPLGRLIQTEHPDGTVSRVVFDAWQQEDWDANDTVLASRWYADRSALPATDPQARAAALTAEHANTPGRTHLDTLGRAHLT